MYCLLSSNCNYTTSGEPTLYLFKAVTRQCTAGTLWCQISLHVVYCRTLFCSMHPFSDLWPLTFLIGEIRWLRNTEPLWRSTTPQMLLLLVGPELWRRIGDARGEIPPHDRTYTAGRVKILKLFELPSSVFAIPSRPRSRRTPPPRPPSPGGL